MPNFQTIIWHKPTGTILQVLPNRYIARRSDLLALSLPKPLPEVAFFYETQPIDISTIEDRIKQIASGNPPVVISSSGEVKSFAAWSHHRRNQISSAHTILCQFEGGMGDQILQAEALHQFYEIFPEKKLIVTVSRPYYDVLKHIEGLKNIHPQDAPPPNIHHDFSLNMHTQYITDPRGGLYGKASLYGASLGLKSVHKSVKLSIPPHVINPIATPHIHQALKTANIKIGIHIRSGSGHAKSWNTEPAETLAKKFIDNKQAVVFLIGKSTDWQMNHHQAPRLDQKHSWLQTAAVLAHLDLLYCIDSGPMHLARCLAIKNITLWGGTSYRDILGRERIQTDERPEIPCIDQVCYDCPKGNPFCMSLHEPEKLYQKGLSILENSTTTQPTIHPNNHPETP